MKIILAFNTVPNNVSYAILSVTPFAEQCKRSCQLYGAYTVRYCDTKSYK